MKSPIIMAKPPSPDIDITCRPGNARLRADRLRHRVGHRAVVERADQPPLAVHLQVARRPHRRRADVAGEDRVVVGQLAQQPRDVLRMDLAAGPACRRPARRDRCAPSRNAPARASRKARRRSWPSGAAAAPRSSSPTSPTTPSVEPAAVAQALGADVDLRDPGVARDRTAGRGSRCPAAAACRSPSSRVARGEADQAGHADVEGVVVLDDTPCRAAHARSAHCSVPASSITASWAPAQPAPHISVIVSAVVQQRGQRVEVRVGGRTTGGRAAPATWPRLASVSSAARRRPGSPPRRHAALGDGDCGSPARRRAASARRWRSVST